ncbi:hypothetical protein C900_01017 [Fulvivirga imtechensis AK7]|uniref:PIN domain-containing protein n=1 Tax=Fulvivirga imtechensis AK7 TaxID=1237149 RepID=L8JWR3_9BACT|nr:PIN domain-containing protein [Fulvivirga imtechensis]ELR72638.1 hypothetical protein C900_01017 [Fulvivirga imtechensis AK7]
MDKVFVDTDVVIDFLIDREPHIRHSSLIFSLAEKKKLQVYISTLSINNIYYVTRRIIGHKKALEIIKNLIEIVEIQSVDKHEILSALDSGFKDFEDGVQHASALHIKGLKGIIARNIKDYKKAQVAVFTPESFLKVFKSKSHG